MTPTRPRSWMIYGLLAVLALCTSLFLVKNVDLSVYWYGVNGFFSGTKSAYGPDSGIGHPMEYRYPPVTYLILYPLRFVTLRVAGFCWIMAAWAAAIAAVSLAIRIRRFEFNGAAVLACCAFMLAYAVLAIRYGNVQPFVICAIFAALTLSETHPFWAGILLSLAITFKIWPFLFIPLLLNRPRFRAASYTVVSLVVLWTLPVAVFGKEDYPRLLREWYTAVGQVGTTYSELYYFPGQSLRGLLLRYFTPVAPPLNSFPLIHVLSLSPRAAVIAWGAISVAVYCVFLFFMLRSNRRKLWAWDGLAFVLYSLLEPYAVKSGLISLGPAALTAACLYTLATRRELKPCVRRFACWGNRLFVAACVVSFLGAIIQYRPWQRFLLSAGLDFWAEILLLAALFIWIVRTPLPESLQTPEEIAYQ